MDNTEKTPLLPQKQKEPAKGESSSFWRGKDKALGWTVATAIMLINFITIGLGRMSGILYVDFMREYRVNRQLASAPFSVQQSCRNLFGPLVGLLGHRFGIRTVTIIGGLIGAFSAAACAFADDIILITVFWGGLYGTGIAFTSTLSQVILDDYFERDLSSASGLSFAGGSVGAMIFSLVLQQTIDDYGLENTYFIMGVVILLVVPLSVTLTSPPWPTTKEENKTESPPTPYTNGSSVNYDRSLSDTEIEDRKKNYDTLPYADSEIFVSCPNLMSSDYLSIVSSGPDEKLVDELGYKRHNSLSESCLVSVDTRDTLFTFYQNLDIKFLQQNTPDVTQIIKLQIVNPEQDWKPHIIDENSPANGDILSRELGDLYLAIHKAGHNLNLNEKYAKLERETNELERSDAESEPEEGSRSAFKIAENTNFYLLSQLRDVLQHTDLQILSNFNDNSKKHIEKVVAELRKVLQFIDAYDGLDSETEHRTFSCCSRLFQCCPFLRQIQIVLKLYLNPAFLLICLCRAVHLLTFMGVLTVVVDFSTDRGLQESDGKYAVASMSLGDLIGRLCTGWITDFRFISLEKFMLIAMFFIGVTSITMPLLPPSCILIMVCVYSILQGSVFIRHPVLVSKYTRLNERTVGMGFMTLFSGLLGFILPVYIGHFRDQIGSYNPVFYINGGICIVIGFLWISENWLKKFIR